MPASARNNAFGCHTNHPVRHLNSLLLGDACHRGFSASALMMACTNFTCNRVKRFFFLSLKLVLIWSEIDCWPGPLLVLNWFLTRSYTAFGGESLLRNLIWLCHLMGLNWFSLGPHETGSVFFSHCSKLGVNWPSIGLCLTLYRFLLCPYFVLKCFGSFGPYLI